MSKVRITWNGMGGELSSVTILNDHDEALTKALIRMVRGEIVSPGDTFTVEEIHPRVLPKRAVK